MAVENGVWTMHGMDWNDPYRIRSYRELINWINEIGFLPLFKNEIEGFSAEEHISNLFWWTGDKEQDPWEWREIIAKSGEVRCKKIMDEFENREEWMGHELKKQAGFYKGGEKNFSGIITELQMQTYLIIHDFRQKRNKKGAEYGMAVSVYMTPEELWGYDLVTSAYKETPEASRERIYRHVQEHYPDATEKQIKTLIK